MELVLKRSYTDLGIDFGIRDHFIGETKENPELLKVVDASGFKSAAPQRLSGKKARQWLVHNIMID